MARPRIDRLFDHTVRIWRPIASSDNRLGVETRDYSVAIPTAGCALNRNVSPVQDQGPGMEPTGRRRFYMRPDLDIRERDLVQIMTGPDAVQTWEVDQPPTRPRDHHTQVDAIAWNGVLPDVGS
jgi:hypothetical protein